MSKHDRDLRGGRDVAGTGPDPRTARHLTPLSETSDFKIVGDDPDVRGWHVFGSNGRELGVVDDLLVDVTQGQVVLLDVIPIDADPKDAARPRASVPIRAAWVDREHERVVLDGAQFDIDKGLPWEVRPLPIVEAANRSADRAADRVADRVVDRPADRAPIRADRPADATNADGINVDALDENARRRGVVVEEHIVRRRVVDPDEVDRLE